MESLTVDIPFDGLGLIGFPAADAISPVYTMWISLVVMYLGMFTSIKCNSQITQTCGLI